ncbi:cyclic GMP-AMP synthase-like receptor 1 [Glandiceps talaboti]
MTGADYLKLNHALEKFTEMKILPSREDSKKVISMCIEKVVNPLLTKVALEDHRFKTDFPLIPIGSYFEGMKVSKSNNFTLLVPLVQLLSFKGFDDVGSREHRFSSYGYVIAKHSAYDISDLVESKPERCHVEGYMGLGVLSAAKLRHKFCCVLETVVQENPLDSDLKISVRQEDAATVLEITLGDQCYNMYLIPCLNFQSEWPPSAKEWGHDLNDWLTASDVDDIKDFGYYVIPQQNLIEGGDENLWHLSFSRSEKFLLRHTDIDSPNGKRKQCERILKTIREANREDFGPVTSHHIKTILLHESKRFHRSDQWTREMLGERFVGVLKSLVSALERRRCQHFFVEGCNLFAQYDLADLNEVAAKMKDIYTEIYNMPESTKYLK